MDRGRLLSVPNKYTHTQTLSCCSPKLHFWTHTHKVGLWVPNDLTTNWSSRPVKNNLSAFAFGFQLSSFCIQGRASSERRNSKRPIIQTRRLQRNNFTLVGCRLCVCWFHIYKEKNIQNNQVIFHSARLCVIDLTNGLLALARKNQRAIESLNKI